MRVEALDHETDFDGWRAAARRLLTEGVRPEDVRWQVGDTGGDLFDGIGRAVPVAKPRTITVPIEACCQECCTEFTELNGVYNSYLNYGIRTFNQWISAW